MEHAFPMPRRENREVLVQAFTFMKCFLEYLLANRYTRLLCNPIYYQYVNGGEPLLCFSTFELAQELSKNAVTPECASLAQELLRNKIRLAKVVDLAVKILMHGRIGMVIGGVLVEVPSYYAGGLKFSGTMIIRKSYKGYSKLKLDMATAQRFYNALIMLLKNASEK